MPALSAYLAASYSSSNQSVVDPDPHHLAVFDPDPFWECRSAFRTIEINQNLQ
jgi:hypothetical protein